MTIRGRAAVPRSNQEPLPPQRCDACHSTANPVHTFTVDDMLITVCIDPARCDRKEVK